MSTASIKAKGIVAAAAALALSAGLALTGCAAPAQSDGSAEPDASKVIRVAATPAPHAEILNDAVAPLLQEQGYTLEVVEFNDYVQPNTVTEAGEVDANYFQHRSYLDSFNDENGTHLVEAGGIHYEPFGLYAGKTDSLDALPDGASVALPNDTTNEARALLLLQQEGLIKLREGAGITATPQDVVENPKNIEFVEVEAATIPRILEDVDIAAINGNYALDAGLSVADDALAIEDASSDAAQVYTNVIVVPEGKQDDEKVKALVEALHSDAVREYIDSTFKGAVVVVS